MTIKRTLGGSDIEQLSAAVYALTELLRLGISDPMRRLSPEDRMIIERAAYSHGRDITPEPQQQNEGTAL